jgi:hypothetical protein
MAQQLRKSFLIFGIALLVLGFFFFYWSIRVNWDYVTTYNNETSLAHSGFSPGNLPQFGAYQYYAGYVVMQPNDALTVSYPENIQINGTLMTVLVDELTDNVLASSTYPLSNGFVDYKNEQPTFVTVEVYLIAQNTQNVTISTTTTLNHFTQPQLIYFGVSAILLSLGTITIFERKERTISHKTLRSIIVIIGLILVVSGSIMFLLEPRIEYGIPGCFCIGTAGPPPIYCSKTIHGLLFDSGLALLALSIILMIVFRKQKTNMKKRENDATRKHNDGNSLA